MKALLLAGTVATVLAGALVFFLLKSPESIPGPPIGSIGGLISTHEPVPAPEKPIVMGFLPYWNFKFLDQLKLDHLTHVAVFGLQVESGGTIRTREADYQEPGYRQLRLNNNALVDTIEASGAAAVLTLVSFENSIMFELLSSESQQQTFIKEVIEYMKTNGYQGGVNIDFEPTGDIQEATQSAFTRFADSMRQEVVASFPEAMVTVSTYGDTAQKPRLWNLGELSDVVDAIFMMAYDYHRPSSGEAGPVAPLLGAPYRWSEDIMTHLDEYTAVMPAEKIILGMPLYGYEWNTRTEELLSPAVSRGITASLTRIQKIQADEPFTLTRVTEGNSPWMIYKKGNRIQQIHYEDASSMSTKVEVAESMGLAGIGFWALGYEVETQHWDEIQFGPFVP